MTTIPAPPGAAPSPVTTDAGLTEARAELAAVAADEPLPRVYIGNVSPGKVSTHYAQCLSDLRLADLTEGWGVVAGVLSGFSGAQISKSRNQIVQTFLDLCDKPDSEADWLLFLDSDMVFPPETVVRLLHAARRASADVVGGLCVMVTELGAIPTLYQWDQIPGSMGYTRVHLEYPRNTLLRVAATGAACIMIHKDVLRGIQEAAGTPMPWFVEQEVKVERDGRTEYHWISEDISFCVKAGELVDARIFVDTTLSIGHAKDGRIWTAADIGSRTGQGTPPIVAVIPMKDRVELTEQLVDRLLLDRVDKIVIIDNGSVESASRAALAHWDDDEDYPRVTVVPMPDAGIHEMWNAGAAYAVDTFGARVHIAFLNNDLSVCPDFLPLLSMALTEHPEYMCVGGNYDERDSGRAIIDTGADICAGRYDGTGGLPGFGFMVKGEFITGGYRFPENMTWWFGDSDLVMSLLYTRVTTGAAGYRAGIVRAAEMVHLDTTGEGPGGGTVGGDWTADEGRAGQLAADKAAFEAKWGDFTARLVELQQAQRAEANRLADHLAEVG